MKNDKQTGIMVEEDEEAGEKIKPNKTERFEQCAIHLSSAPAQRRCPPGGRTGSDDGEDGTRSPRLDNFFVAKSTLE